MDRGAGCSTGSFLRATAIAEATGQSLAETGRVGVVGKQPRVAPSNAIGCPWRVNLSILRISLQKLKKALELVHAVIAVQRSFSTWVPLSSHGGTLRSPTCFGVDGGHLPGHLSCWALSAGHPPSPSPTFPEGQVDSLLSIISSQRERFRARNQELEGVCGVGRGGWPWGLQDLQLELSASVTSWEFMISTTQAAPRQAREK